jgi:magnesium-transporting ATPase (P-type)
MDADATPEPGDPSRRVLAQFQDPLVHLLLAAIAISFGAWLAEGAEGVPVDVVVIALIVVGNAVIGLVQQARTVEAVAALADLTAAASTPVLLSIDVFLPGASSSAGTPSR